MISILGVSKFYGSLQVLKDVSFDIGAGEVVVVCGPSGSGKSTLLRCLNKLEFVNAGKIIVDDIEVTSPAPPSISCARRLGSSSNRSTCIHT